MSAQVSHNYSNYHSCHSAWSLSSVPKAGIFNREMLLISHSNKTLCNPSTILCSSLGLHWDWAGKRELQPAPFSGRVLFGLGKDVRACRDPDLSASPLVTQTFQLCVRPPPGTSLLQSSPQTARAQWRERPIPSFRAKGRKQQETGRRNYNISD